MIFSTPIIEIVIIVATAVLNSKLDLDDIAVKFPDVESHAEQFPGAVFRLRNPKTATLLFSTGKMVCAGGKTEKDVYHSINQLFSMLEEKDLMIYD